MGSVTKLNPYSEPDEVLEKAKGCYSEVLVIGYDKDGALDARATQSLSEADTFFLVEQFKQFILDASRSE